MLYGLGKASVIAQIEIDDRTSHLWLNNLKLTLVVVLSKRFYVLQCSFAGSPVYEGP